MSSSWFHNRGAAEVGGGESGSGGGNATGGGAKKTGRGAKRRLLSWLDGGKDTDADAEAEPANHADTAAFGGFGDFGSW